MNPEPNSLLNKRVRITFDDGATKEANLPYRLGRVTFYDGKMIILDGSFALPLWRCCRIQVLNEGE